MAVVSGSTRVTHQRRLAETRELLGTAAACEDPERRRAIMLEVAALNADEALAVACALCRRYGTSGIDQRALKARALDSYLAAVLEIEPTSELDVLARVAPVLRAAVVRSARESVGVPVHT